MSQTFDTPATGFPPLIIEGLKRALMLARPFAAMTATKLDDAAVEVLDALINSQAALDAIWAAFTPVQQAAIHAKLG